MNTIDSTDHKYAGFWIRLCAYTLDTVFLAIITSPILIISIFSGLNNADNADEIASIATALYIIIAIAYLTVIPATKWQATPGKRLLSIYIINKDGSKPSFWKILARTIIGHFLCTIVLYCGYILIGFHPKKQGLHDILFRTLVVYGKPNTTNK